MRRVLIVSHRYVDPANRGKLRALAARDLDVTIGVPQRWKEQSLGLVRETRWERASGLEVFPIAASGPGDVARFHFSGRALAALVRDKRPDLIQVEEDLTTTAAQQVVKVAARLKIPSVVFTAQNVPQRLPLGQRWSRRRTLRRLRGLVAGNAAAAALIRRERSEAELPIAVIPQLGVMVPPAPVHHPHEGLSIGYVGRLVEAKGVDTLLEALAAIRQGDWHLTVVGDGPDRERLEALATRLRLAARIRWSGALPPEHLTRLWPDIDVLVLPSRPLPTWSEPHGHALLEAMAHEVAVLGSDAGVIPELIGDAGLVVPAADPAALAEALRRLARDAERAPLAQAARARSMRLYSDDAIAERTLEFWKDLLEPSRQPL